MRPGVEPARLEANLRFALALAGEPGLLERICPDWQAVLARRLAGLPVEVGEHARLILVAQALGCSGDDDGPAGVPAVLRRPPGLDAGHARHAEEGAA